MNNFDYYIILPRSGQCIRYAGFGTLCNSSTASGEGTPELYCSNFGLLYFLLYPKV